MGDLIRAITTADLADILSIEQQAHSHPWPLAQFSQRLTGPRHRHAVLLCAGSIAGYYMASEIVGEAELLNIAVAPAQQGKGFGARLLQHLIERLGDQTQTLFLEVRESNLAAIALYEKLNFHQLGRRGGYYPCAKHGREDALLYALSLP